MTARVSTRLAATLGLSTLIAACGSATLTAASPAPATAQIATPTAAPTAIVAATRSAAGPPWTVADKSRATVRVREQLVGVGFPSDAGLLATRAAGTLVRNAAGPVLPDSQS